MTQLAKNPRVILARTQTSLEVEGATLEAWGLLLREICKMHGVDMARGKCVSQASARIGTLRSGPRLEVEKLPEYQFQV